MIAVLFCIALVFALIAIVANYPWALIIIIALFTLGVFAQRTGYKPRSRFNEAAEEVTKLIKKL